MIDNPLLGYRTILRLDASARVAGSYSRALVDRLVAAMTTADPDTLTTVRDLAFANPPVVDEAWTLANNTLAAERTAEQRAALAASDQLIAELITADTLVIGCPIYNFAIPAPLKAWLDQICRARVTFTYSDNGPKGLLTGKRAIVVMTSGGTAVSGEIDFATPYLKHILGFIGIENVTFIAADRLMMNGAVSLALAHTKIDAFAASLSQNAVQ